MSKRIGDIAENLLHDLENVQRHLQSLRHSDVRQRTECFVTSHTKQFAMSQLMRPYITKRAEASRSEQKLAEASRSERNREEARRSEKK